MKIGDCFMKVLVMLTHEDLGYVAKDAETHVASQGASPEEAINNLKEALMLYYEDDVIPATKEFFTTTLEVAI